MIEIEIEDGDNTIAGRIAVHVNDNGQVSLKIISDDGYHDLSRSLGHITTVCKAFDVACEEFLREQDENV